MKHVIVLLFILCGFSAEAQIFGKKIKKADEFRASEAIELRGLRIDSFSTDGTFSSASDFVVPTQLAVREYLDLRVDTTNLLVTKTALLDTLQVFRDTLAGLGGGSVSSNRTIFLLSSFTGFNDTEQIANAIDSCKTDEYCTTVFVDYEEISVDSIELKEGVILRGSYSMSSLNGTGNYLDQGTRINALLNDSTRVFIKPVGTSQIAGVGIENFIIVPEGSPKAIISTGDAFKMQIRDIHVQPYGSAVGQPFNGLWVEQGALETNIERVSIVNSKNAFLIEGSNTHLDKVTANFCTFGLQTTENAINQLNINDSRFEKFDSTTFTINSPKLTFNLYVSYMEDCPKSDHLAPTFDIQKARGVNIAGNSIHSSPSVLAGHYSLKIDSVANVRCVGNTFVNTSVTSVFNTTALTKELITESNNYATAIFLDDTYINSGTRLTSLHNRRNQGAYADSEKNEIEDFGTNKIELNTAYDADGSTVSNDQIFRSTDSLYYKNSFGTVFNLISGNITIPDQVMSRTGTVVHPTTTTDFMSLGLTTAVQKFHIHQPSGAGVGVAVTNTQTGSTVSDGAFFGISGSESLVFNQRENLGMDFATNNSIRLTISNIGAFRFLTYGIGTNAGTLSRIAGFDSSGNLIEPTVAEINTYLGSNNAMSRTSTTVHPTTTTDNIGINTSDAPEGLTIVSKNIRHTGLSNPEYLFGPNLVFRPTSVTGQKVIFQDESGFEYAVMDATNGDVQVQGAFQVYDGTQYSNALKKTSAGAGLLLGNSNFNRIAVPDNGVVIGSETIDGSAALEINSTTQGLLFPRMTTTQRDAVSAVAGLVVYNTTTNKLQCYDGTIWNDLF